jgi:hypothetical protein
VWALKVCIGIIVFVDLMRQRCMAVLPWQVVMIPHAAASYSCTLVLTAASQLVPSAVGGCNYAVLRRVVFVCRCALAPEQVEQAAGVEPGRWTDRERWGKAVQGRHQLLSSCRKLCLCMQAGDLYQLASLLKQQERPQACPSENMLLLVLTEPSLGSRQCVNKQHYCA